MPEDLFLGPAKRSSGMGEECHPCPHQEEKTGRADVSHETSQEFEKTIVLRKRNSPELTGRMHSCHKVVGMVEGH